MDNINNKPLNENEHKELVGMKQQLAEMRHERGLIDEQIEQIQARKVLVAQTTQTHLQAFNARIANMAKSYGLELGVVKDGKIWQFDLDNLVFIEKAVPQKPSTENTN